MIIRKITQAIRDQSWASVLVEFMIVVVGIYVGLQANNWNEARIDRKQEQESLERLLSEAENAVAVINQEVELFSRYIDAQRALLEIVTSDESVPEDTTVALNGYATLTFYPAMVPPRTTYNELLATGGIQLIRSRHLRDMIAMYYAELEFFQAQVNYFRDSSLGIGGDPYVASRDYVNAVYDPKADSGRSYEIAWQGLRSDPLVETLFVDKFRNQIVMNGNRNNVLSRAQKMCNAIAEAINSQCNPVISGGAK